MKIVIAYIPVLHAGYVEFLSRHLDADLVYILGEELIGLLDYLTRKDLRRIRPGLLQELFIGWDDLPPVQVLTPSIILASKQNWSKIIMPNEDISHIIASQYFIGKQIQFENVFLRYHKDNVEQQSTVNPQRFISGVNLTEELMLHAYNLADKSADWWRQVGALIVRDGNVLLTGYNSHVPSSQQPYYLGDPRSIFKKGINIELSTALHAEAALICEAARNGISLNGADLFVTTFPCPNCAKLIAYSGIKKIYFCEGYSMLDGESILTENGVSIVQVNI